MLYGGSRFIDCCVVVLGLRVPPDSRLLFVDFFVFGVLACAAQLGSTRACWLRAFCQLAPAAAVPYGVRGPALVRTWPNCNGQRWPRSREALQTLVGGRHGLRLHAPMVASWSTPSSRSPPCSRTCAALHAHSCARRPRHAVIFNMALVEPLDGVLVCMLGLRVMLIVLVTRGCFTHRPH